MRRCCSHTLQIVRPIASQPICAIASCQRPWNRDATLALTHQQKQSPPDGVVELVHRSPLQPYPGKQAGERPQILLLGPRRLAPGLIITRDCTWECGCALASTPSSIILVHRLMEGCILHNACESGSEAFLRTAAAAIALRRHPLPTLINEKYHGTNTHACQTQREPNLWIINMQT